MLRILFVLLTFAATAPVARAAVEDDVTHARLDNGLQIVVIQDRRAPVVTHMIWYKGGAIDEVAGQSGIAHFLEHLMFKGTDTLAPGEFSRVVADNGGTGNAFTSADFTGYFQRVASDRLGLMMQMEADRMRNLRISDEDIETERAVVLQERASRVDNSPEAVFREQREAALYLNHPYGRPVIGWAHEIEVLTREQIMAFYRRHYAPNNAILVVAGDVDPEDVIAMARVHYGPIAAAANLPARVHPAEPPQLAARRMSFTDPRVRQPYVSRSYLAPGRQSGDQKPAAALSMLSRLLGGGVTSWLTEELVYEQAVALDAGAYYRGASLGPGVFGVYITPREGISLDEAEGHLDAALAAFLEVGPDPAELERLKAQARAQEIYALDSQRGRAQRYGAGLASGLTVADIEGWSDLVQALSVEDVQNAARGLFDLRRSVTGHIWRGDDP